MKGEEDTMEKFVVIETGGSIGENANFGHARIVGDKYFFNKEAATNLRKSMTRLWAGGYYGYHYSVKTLAWALKNNNKIKEENIVRAKEDVE